MEYSIAALSLSCSRAALILSKEDKARARLKYDVHSAITRTETRLSTLVMPASRPKNNDPSSDVSNPFPPLKRERVVSLYIYTLAFVLYRVQESEIPKCFESFPTSLFFLLRFHENRVEREKFLPYANFNGLMEERSLEVDPHTLNLRYVSLCVF